MEERLDRPSIRRNYTSGGFLNPTWEIKTNDLKDQTDLREGWHPSCHNIILKYGWVACSHPRPGR